MRKKIKNPNKKDKITISLVHPYITDTNFFKNLVRSTDDRRTGRASDEVDRGMPPADPPEKMAIKILQAVETGKAEIML